MGELTLRLQRVYGLPTTINWGLMGMQCNCYGSARTEEVHSYIQCET